MCVFTRLSLLLTDVWANLSYLFFFGEVIVYTIFGKKASQCKVLSKTMEFLLAELARNLMNQ